jgi:putative ABC transport system ATP-binding protein
MSFIQAVKLCKVYGDGDAAVHAIRDISLDICAGEFVAVMGESGAGKSTLLDIMGAMNVPSSGSLIVDGIDVYSIAGENRADFRREYLGFVFQGFHLVNYLTVLENVMLPLTTTGFERKKKIEMAKSALSWVGLEKKSHRLPGQISGGEKERVAIARAIVNHPPILLADEPTGNLDAKTSDEIIGLLHRLNDQGMTIFMVTHSKRCADSAKRTLIVSDGMIVADSQKPDAGPDHVEHGIPETNSFPVLLCESRYGRSYR